MAAVAVLALGLLALNLGVVSAVKTTTANRETGVALEAAQAQLETLRGEPLSEVFSRYNDDPTDDPTPGVPGPGFVVQGLDAQAGDQDGMVGEIVFPTVQGALREDVFDATLRMPRDLNGDGDLDKQDHATDYVMLPVLVRVSWRGERGDREFQLAMVLSEP